MNIKAINEKKSAQITPSFSGQRPASAKIHDVSAQDSSLKQCNSVMFIGSIVTVASIIADAFGIKDLIKDPSKSSAWGQVICSSLIIIASIVFQAKSLRTLILNKARGAIRKNFT